MGGVDEKNRDWDRWVAGDGLDDGTGWDDLIVLELLRRSERAMLYHVVDPRILSEYGAENGW